MSDLIEQLRDAAAAGGANAALLTEAADRIVAMNGEHDAMCTQREGMVTKVRELVLVHDGEADGTLSAAVAGLAATLPPEDVVPPPGPPVLVQTSAQPIFTGVSSTSTPSTQDPMP